MKVLVDTNIILDIALERQPFVESATRLFACAPQANLALYVTATTITDLYYITRKAKDHATARDFIADLLQFMDVAGVDKAVIVDALNSEITDFEDAIQESVAKQHTISIIITRNEKDFENSGLKIYNPESFLQSL